MADLLDPVFDIGDPGYVQGMAVHFLYAGLSRNDPGWLARDWRHLRPNTGVITDRVMLRSGTGAEVPFAMGRVWLLRLADGWKAWEGWSDAAGYYTAEGLELGVEYIAVGIDPLRNHKATGAGPVRAALPEAP